MARKMTPRQQRFVEQYVVDLNATQAAIRAGYSPKTAKQIGSKLLTKIDIQEAVAVRQIELSKATGVTAQRVITELAKIGFANMEDYMRVDENGGATMDLSALTRDQAAAISEVTSETVIMGHGDDVEPIRKSKIKLHAKQSALEMLGRHLGVFEKDNQQRGNVQVTVTRKVVNF